MKKTPYDHLPLFKELGYNPGRMGCLMLDVEPVLLPLSAAGRKLSDALYSSSHPDRSWIDGAVGEKGAHATLLYGLMKPAIEYMPEIIQLLIDLPIREVQITAIEKFESTFADEPYTCIVGLVDHVDLREANRRLRWLPHIDTFTEYRPHVTLAYVKKEEADLWANEFSRSLRGVHLKALGLNYGE